MTYTHGVERDKLATAVRRLHIAYRTLAAQAERAQARRNKAIAEEKAARATIDQLLDTANQLRDEIDALGLDISTRVAAGQRPRPNLWGERYQAGVA